ncbi:hypothetical protein H8I91_24920 [Serratia fonticola]|uniref:DNA-packaging protein FI n=1 Tax=Serratia fonticola TaxID=47917 RepID=UPI00164635D5|nr:DNA-packaging protein FI [Serratia fonticola]MBC3253512.1 hypothetical protein [Serratia fonticola]
MATKNELIAQLLDMGGVLGRELLTSGSVAELELRVREAQEEIAQLNEDGIHLQGGIAGAAGADAVFPGESLKPTSQALPELVKVCPLKTLHIAGAWHETKNEAVTMAIANKAIRVSPELADELVIAGLATEVEDE